MKKFILTLLATVATVSVAYVAPKQESDGGTKDEEKKELTTREIVVKNPNSL